MNEPTDFVRIVNRTRYSVAKATLIASDCFWDGHNFERQGRNTWLYRTYKGRYFTVTCSQWQGERDRLEPVTEDEALELYESRLFEHAVDYAGAFPTVGVEDA